MHVPFRIITITRYNCSRSFRIYQFQDNNPAISPIECALMGLFVLGQLNGWEYSMQLLLAGRTINCGCSNEERNGMLSTGQLNFIFSRKIVYDCLPRKLFTQLMIERSCIGAFKWFTSKGSTSAKFN